MANDDLDLPDPDAASAAVLAGARVLVASGHPDEQALATLLARCNVIADQTDDCGVALGILARSTGRPYRAVLLAESLSGMASDVLGSALRADAACGPTLLALCSGDPSHRDAAWLTRAGFDLWLDRRQPATVRLAHLALHLASGRPPAPPSDESGFGSKGRILVADDNPVNREMALRMLEQLGYQAEMVADGIEALAAHRAAPYDLILMDCEMPQLDGYAATVRIRAGEASEEGARHTPVLALTAYGGPEQEAKCRRAGMDGLLTKPVRPQMLREALERWMHATSPVPVNAQPPLQGDELEAVQAMFGSDFEELAALYQHDSPGRIERLRQAHAHADHALVAKIAHALGGSSASIGATTLAALCKELEMRIKSGAQDDLGVRVAHIDTEYRRISSKLQSMLTSRL